MPPPTGSTPAAAIACLTRIANPLPLWALPFVIGAALAIAWMAYRHTALRPSIRAALTALRFVTLLLLVVFLMRPIARSTEDDARDAVVAVLVDSSRSMSIQDAGGDRRIDRARGLVAGELLPALSSRFRTELFAYGDGLAPVEVKALSAGGRRSDLGGALTAVRDRLKGRAVAGIVLVSDGGDTIHMLFPFRISAQPSGTA